MKPIAVVTGGAGFIGSHMTDLLLSRGFLVRIIDNLQGGHLANLEHLSSNTDLRVDIRDIRDLTAGDRLFAGAKYVFHFAGIGDIIPSVEKPVEYMSVNVQGTVKVLECAREAMVSKTVYAASSSCYGLAKVTPTPEEAAIQPEYPYALSKTMGEQAVLHWGQVYRIPVNSVRIFNAYGPRSRTTGAYGAVFGVFLAQKLNGKPFTVVGDGTQRRDFVFVTDVAEAFLAAAETERSQQVYNVGSGGQPPSINRLVELLDGPVVYLPKRPGEPECTWADVTKLRTELGWEAKVRFEDGVQEMVKHIHAWKNAPVWDKDSIRSATESWFHFMEGRGN